MRMKDRFHLVICMVGSASCNPVLESMLRRYWDDRFFFSSWDTEFMDRLLTQQEDLKKAGKTRSVLLLVDDVVMTSKADEQLAHLCMRGRHFQVSVIMCAVSYTNLPKRARRSLDVLLCFSCPLSGDMQVLTYEYARQSKMARWALKHLEDHQCLVLETLEKRQKLFVWKADLWSLTETEETSQPVCAEKSETATVPETPSGRQTDSRQTGTFSVSDSTQSSAEQGGGSPVEETPKARDDPPRSKP